MSQFSRTSRLLFSFPIFLASVCVTTNDAWAKGFKIKKGDRIVFLGDSITQAGARPNGFVSLVRNAIHERFPELGVKVIGAGISGHKVPDLEKRLDRDVISKKPTVVVIYIGINDVWHSLSGRGTSKKDYEEGLIRLIDRIEKVNAKVILCTPSVIGEKTDGSNKLDKMLDEYCAISRKVAKAKSCAMLDLRKRFLKYLKKNNPKNQPRNVLTVDGVHLNATGNRFVTDCMLDALGASKTNRLLRHVVLFKFKGSTSPTEVREVVDAFAALPEKIDSIVDFEFGTDVSVENKAAGFTHGFIVTFASAKGREHYLPHAAHRAFVKLVGPRVEKVLVFDYWAKK